MSEKKILTRADMETHEEKPETFEVDMPEWGGVLLARKLTVGEMIDLQAMLKSDDDGRDPLEKANDLIVFLASDPEGKQLFKPEDAKAPWMRKKTFTAQTKFIVEAFKFNGLNQGALEAFTKN